MGISLPKRITVPPHVLVRQVGSESVFLNLKNEQYFGLDETGTRLWARLAAEDSIQAAYEALLAEFDVEPERLRSDLRNLVARLRDHGLVEIEDT